MCSIPLPWFRYVIKLEIIASKRSVQVWYKLIGGNTYIWLRMVGLWRKNSHKALQAQNICWKTDQAFIAWFTINGPFSSEIFSSLCRVFLIRTAMFARCTGDSYYFLSRCQFLGNQISICNYFFKCHRKQSGQWECSGDRGCYQLFFLGRNKTLEVQVWIFLCKTCIFVPL